MTEVDTALTREENQSGDDSASAAAIQDSSSIAPHDPFAPPPPVEKSLTFIAEQRHTSCFTTDTTLQPILFRVDARGSSIEPAHLRDSRGIDAHDGKSHRYSLNLALVVDRSGSMEGRWLEHIKRACGTVLDLAGHGDFVSVISFAETAHLILPARHVSDKAEAKDSISRITVGNTTNLRQALLVAYQQLSAVKHSGTLNRIILVTSGPTAGTKDLSSIVSQVVDQKSRGISVSSVGLGNDYDEELLASVAHRTGGNYYHVADPECLEDAVKQEFELLTRVVARNLRLRVRLARGAGVRTVYGQQPVYGDRVVETDLCDVEAGGGLQSLWEFELSTRPAGRYRIGQADLRYDDVNTGRPERLVADLIYEFTAEPNAVQPATSIDFDREIEVAEAIRDVDKTLLAVRRQNLEPAAVLQELEKVKATFTKHGRQQEIAAVAKAAADIEAGGSLVKTLMSTVFNLDQGKTH
jgi:Ca-activated chloride channel family protein